MSNDVGVFQLCVMYFFHLHLRRPLKSSRLPHEVRHTISAKPNKHIASTSVFFMHQSRSSYLCEWVHTFRAMSQPLLAAPAASPLSSSLYPHKAAIAQTLSHCTFGENGSVFAELHNTQKDVIKEPIARSNCKQALSVFTCLICE